MSSRIRPGFIAVLIAMVSLAARAKTPPAPPVIVEPAEGAAGLSAADVHMVTAPFVDADPDDEHLCTDWEIRTADGDLAWSASCATGALAVHIHLGDGTGGNESALEHEQSYRLRVRHRDDSGDPATEWSAWSEREFRTASARHSFPMRLASVVLDPEPAWTDATGSPILANAPPVLLQIRQLDGSVLLQVPADGAQEIPAAAADSGDHQPVFVMLTAGDVEAHLPESVLVFHDASFRARSIHFPAVTLAPGEPLRFWVTEDGGTWWAGEESEPSFHALARGGAVPWSGGPAVRIERVATGFRLPVALAFAPPPAAADDPPDAPWLYVAELYGTIRAVARDGSVSDYATDLLGFDASGPFPGNGEQGIGGMAVDPASGDLFFTAPHRGEDGVLVPRVTRLFSSDGGRTAAGSSVVFELTGAPHVASHQISEISIGPDGHLYVHVGDAHQPLESRNPDSFLGKILRIARDGSAPTDNPFYDASDGISPRDYVYALGLRNPFGGAWRSRDGALYVVDNGPSKDRIVRSSPGADHGWDGTDESIVANALHAWVRSAAPVRIRFLDEATFAGSGFPASWMDSAIVTESGSTWAEGPQWAGKLVTTFGFDEDGSIRGGEELVRYVGSGHGTAAALAAGPDGIYFSDLYRDYGARSPLDPGASIFRVRFVGSAGFALDRAAEDPLTIELTDTSDYPGAVERQWTIGESAAGGDRTVRHTFSEPGVHAIRLRVSNGVEESVAGAEFLVGAQHGSGLLAEYYADGDPTGRATLRRVDATVDFDWREEPPAPEIPAGGFVVRWRGSLEARVTAEHRFHATAQGTLRAWVDGTEVVNAAGVSNPGSVWLTAGRQYDVWIEYIAGPDEALARLQWSTPFHGPEPIPTAALRPAADGTRRRLLARP